MFKNIGKKIKVLAQVFTWLGILAFLALGIFIAFLGFMNEEAMIILLGIIIAVIGFFVSWIGSFILYAFGEIADSTEQTKKLIELQNAILHKMASAPARTEVIREPVYSAPAVQTAPQAPQTPRPPVIQNNSNMASTPIYQSAYEDKSYKNPKNSVNNQTVQNNNAPADNNSKNDDSFDKTVRVSNVAPEQNGSTSNTEG